MRKIFKKPLLVGIDFPPLRENGNRSTEEDSTHGKRHFPAGRGGRRAGASFFRTGHLHRPNDAAGEGITSRELVEEARRVAHNYASSGTSRFSNRWRTLNPIVYTLIGAGTIGLAWLIVALA